MSTVFITSVSEAVSTSVATDKPMMVLITDGTEPSEKWGKNLLLNNETQGSGEDGLVTDAIQGRAVALKLLKPSTEFDYFSQIFHNVPVPSIYFIKTGQLLDVILGDVTKDQFRARLFKVLSAGNQSNVNSRDQTSNGEESRSTNAPFRESVQISVSTPTTQHTESAQAASNPRAVANPPVPEGPEQNTESPLSQLNKPEKASNDNKDKPATASKTPQRKKYHSIREQIAEESAKHYREEQLRKKKLEKEEKERILRLVRSDKRERKQLDDLNRRQKSHGINLSDTKVSEANRDAASETSEGKVYSSSRGKEKAYTSCILSIRLLNGSKITHTFSPADTLELVRQWVDGNRTDGDQPYVFYEAVTRKSYSAIEEHSSLSELGLLPRSALTLKAEQNYSNAYAKGSSDSWFNKVSSAFYSVLGYEDEGASEQTNEHQSASVQESDRGSSLSALHRGDSSTGINTSQHHEFDRRESASPFVRSVNVSADDLSSFYSSSSHVNGSITSLSDLNNSRNNKDREKKMSYNGNQTNLEDDSPNSYKRD